ncbi:MAG: hypothetical protein P8P74_00750 [Crocinitomicaceae bacterium]|nr:hypothetical protein [Crocinitomicaceae bacterium]
MKTLSLIYLLFASAIAFSQDGKTNILYTRIRACEPSIGFQKELNAEFSIAAEVGYRFRFTEEAYVPYGVISYPVQLYWMNRAYSGFSVRPFILNFRSSDWATQSLSTSYRYLSADNIIYDAGKNGGSNQSEYAEYAMQKHEIGLSYIFSKSLRRLPILSWYYEVGVNLNLFERQYTIEGSYSNPLPSNRISSGQSFGLQMHFGLKLDMVKW